MLVSYTVHLQTRIELRKGIWSRRLDKVSQELQNLKDRMQVQLQMVLIMVIMIRRRRRRRMRRRKKTQKATNFVHP